MQDWTAGYVADIGYTFGYYAELNPLRVQIAFLNAGLRAPHIGTACELGFGQGISTNMHAAASVTQWCGTDFNPSQAGFAQELAATAQAGARLFDDTFAQFADRTDLPDFDYIGLHGIWSWISDENRAVIVDFVRRKLKVGGVLYISYNTMPGWAAFAPIRHLMAEHAETIGSQGHGIVNRVDGALGFAEKLMATNPIFARANPQVAERLTKLKEQNRHYLAHEYFNRDWQPMHVNAMAGWLAPAKLRFACSAHYQDCIDAINLTAEQRVFLNDVPDPMLRETARDFMVNQQFRRDYWVKGARKINGLEQLEALRMQRVMLVKSRADVTLSVAGALGEASLSEAVYKPLLDLLADHAPRTLLHIEAALKPAGLEFAQVRQAILILIGKGDLAAVQDDPAIAAAKPSAARLNAHLMTMARVNSDVNYLACPVTGGAIAVGRIQQLFLLARIEGGTTPDEWAQFVWQLLKMQGHKLVKDGQTIATDDANLAELTAQVHQFATTTLPILTAMGIAE
jgi:SAM-dependent methyltransferase